MEPASSRSRFERSDELLRDEQATFSSWMKVVGEKLTLVEKRSVEIDDVERVLPSELLDDRNHLVTKNVASDRVRVCSEYRHGQ